MLLIKETFNRTKLECKFKMAGGALANMNII